MKRWLLALAAPLIVWCAAPAVAVAGSSTPFTECPAVGQDTGCEFLVVVGDGSQQVFVDPAQAPYGGGSSGALVGVVNDTSVPLVDLHLSAAGLFQLAGHGICQPSGWSTQGGPVPSGCPFQAGPPGYVPSGYEGPSSYFQNIAADGASGDVAFAGGIAPGGSSYFSLASPLAGQSISVGYPVAIDDSVASSTARGASILTAPGQAVVDTARLQGPSVPAAGGTVTYDVYADAGCTRLVKASPAMPVSAGSAGSSGPVALPAGTYWWQSVYSGDAANQPARSTCGAEIQSTCEPSSSATVRYDDLTASRQGELKPGAISLARIKYRFMVAGAGYVPATKVAFVANGHPLVGETARVGSNGSFMATFEVSAATLAASEFRAGAAYAIVSTDTAGCASTAHATLGSTAKDEAQRRAQLVSKAAISDGLALASLSHLDGVSAASLGQLGFAAALAGGATIAWESWTSANYSEIAEDPPDPDYRTVITPPRLAISLQVPATVSTKVRSLVLALVTKETSDGEALYALRVSLDRAAAAQSAHQMACVARQHQAAVGYANDADRLEVAEQGLLARFANLLQTLSRAQMKRTFTDTQLTTAAERIVHQGIPASLLRTWSAAYGAALARQLKLSLQWAAKVVVAAEKPTPAATAPVPGVPKQDLAPGATAFSSTRAGLGPHYLADLISTSTTGAGNHAKPSACH